MFGGFGRWIAEEEDGSSLSRQIPQTPHAIEVGAGKMAMPLPPNEHEINLKVHSASTLSLFVEVNRLSGFHSTMPILPQRWMPGLGIWLPLVSTQVVVCQLPAPDPPQISH